MVPTTLTEKQIRELPAVEKIELIGKLWDALEEEMLPDLTPDQIEEIRARLRHHQGKPLSEFTTWESVKDKYRSL